jgi:hypothetical protein
MVPVNPLAKGMIDGDEPRELCTGRCCFAQANDSALKPKEHISKGNYTKNNDNTMIV